MKRSFIQVLQYIHLASLLFGLILYEYPSENVNYKIIISLFVIAYLVGGYISFRGEKLLAQKWEMIYFLIFKFVFYATLVVLFMYLLLFLLLYFSF